MPNTTLNSINNLISDLIEIKDEVAKLDLENKMALKGQQLIIFEQLPELIKSRRLADDLSIDDFSLQIGINSKTLRKLENPKQFKSTSMNSLLSVCDHLGIQIMAKG